jgi:hypothetical protein
MSEFDAKPFSFSRLNSVLGVSTPPIPYCWRGAEVFLDSREVFDQKSYLASKLNTLLSRETVLTESNIRELFARVIDHNLNILFDLHNCAKDRFQQFDAKLNLLLEAAFTHAENEVNLIISKNNITISQQNSDGWMNAVEVGKLVDLVSSHGMQAPDPHKFVPKYRR